MSNLTQTENSTRYNVMKRLGLFGFTFFFVKGLLWLAFVYFAHSFI